VIEIEIERKIGRERDRKRKKIRKRKDDHHKISDLFKHCFNKIYNSSKTDCYIIMAKNLILY
jgi:hypothetical protein